MASSTDFTDTMGSNGPKISSVMSGEFRSTSTNTVGEMYRSSSLVSPPNATVPPDMSRFSRSKWRGDTMRP